MNYLFLVIIVSFSLSVDSARILCVFMLPSISHHIVYRAITHELHERGHDLTIITTDPIPSNSTRYKQIDVGPSTYKTYKESFNFAQDYEKRKPLFISYVSSIFTFFSAISAAQLGQTEIQDLIHSGEKFDLIIFEYVLMPSYLGLACQFSTPFVGIFSAGGTFNMHDAVGNPSHPAYLSDMWSESLDQMNFVERFESTVNYVISRYLYYYNYVPLQDEISRKYITKECPYVGDMERKVDLILANTNFGISFPRPNVPAMVEFGGLPRANTKSKPLPIDLKTFLDEATDGVVYMSLGTNVKSHLLSESKRNQFLTAFKNLKQKVLWKWENDTLPGQPNNVKISKWLPQSDIFAHPSIKAFITQGGLQSMGEAIQHNIPLVVIPVVADQMHNAKKLESMGVAIKLNFKELTSKDLYDSLHKVMSDVSYKDNLKKYKLLLSDQPQEPIEKAVWWIEYVIRHKGAKHMRSAAVDMPLYQYLLLDVIGAVLSIVVVIVYLVVYLIKLILRLTTNKHKTE